MISRLVFLAALSGWAISAPTPKSSKQASSVDALKFLQQYGYLHKVPDGEVEALYSEESVVDAIKEAQRFGRIPVTGKLDNSTIRLMKSKRCGVSDVVAGYGKQRGHRYKRFVIASPGWKRRHLTYAFINVTPKLPRDAVRAEFRRALDTWSRYSSLTFTEIDDPSIADIKVGFFSGYHGDRYAFDGAGSVLAHAFFPYNYADIDGDVHFDDDEHWVMRPGPFDVGTDFGKVALHELGHSLGLAHSHEAGSVMNPYYTGTEQRDLGYDDILAMHRLYLSRQLEENVPRTTRGWYGPRVTYGMTTPWRSTRWTGRTTREVGSATTPLPTTTELLPRDEPRPQEPSLADGCQGGYDAVALLRGELYIVKNLTLWRLTEPREVMHGFPVEFHRFFHKFPQVDKIDAMYQRESDSSIVTFSGNKYWIFDGWDFIEDSPKPITDFGLPETVKSVDAAMVSDSKALIFSGDMYWRYNETSKSLDEGFPRRFTDDFKGLPEKLDAAITWKDGVSYFFKGNKYWAVDNGRSETKDGYPRTASTYWLPC